MFNGLKICSPECQSTLLNLISDWTCTETKIYSPTEQKWNVLHTLSSYPKAHPSKLTHRNLWSLCLFVGGNLLFFIHDLFSFYLMKGNQLILNILYKGLIYIYILLGEEYGFVVVCCWWFCLCFIYFFNLEKRRLTSLLFTASSWQGREREVFISSLWWLLVWPKSMV